MKAKVWTYSDPDNQKTHYRGYVAEYKGTTIIAHGCKEVRKNKLKAMEDSKKLLKKLKNK